MYREQLDLEQQLGSFDEQERRDALERLHEMLVTSQVSAVPEFEAVNLHCHTFFSFNAYGYSPSAYAWEAKKRGLYAAGTVDFDVLDGVNEFLDATELLGVRSVAGMESRVIIPELRDAVINSPGEPGIYYFMGTGFDRGSPELRSSHEGLGSMHHLAQQRNRVIIDKLNGYLRDITVDYENDVLPLTPAGNPTERHILVALYRKGEQHFPDEKKRAAFWAEAMELQREEVLELSQRPVDLQMQIRSRLIKKGGPGYTLPDDRSFPSLKHMTRVVLELHGVPTHTWLDGTADGERDPGNMLDFIMAEGAACMNIVPDRNWNLSDPEERKLKIGKLHEVVAEADKRDLPIIVGTEMNKQGQGFVDNFFAGPMRQVRGAFLRGARIMTGHTSLMRAMGIGMLDGAVQERFGRNTKKRNDFFEQIGALQPDGSPGGGMKRRKAVKEIWEKGV
jgi:hypothetical protein